MCSQCVQISAFLKNLQTFTRVAARAGIKRLCRLRITSALRAPGPHFLPVQEAGIKRLCRLRITGALRAPGPHFLPVQEAGIKRLCRLRITGALRAPGPHFLPVQEMGERTRQGGTPWNPTAADCFAKAAAASLDFETCIASAPNETVSSGLMETYCAPRLWAGCKIRADHAINRCR